MFFYIIVLLVCFYSPLIQTGEYYRPQPATVSTAPIEQEEFQSFLEKYGFEDKPKVQQTNEPKPKKKVQFSDEPEIRYYNPKAPVTSVAGQEIEMVELKRLKTNLQTTSPSNAKSMMQDITDAWEDLSEVEKVTATSTLKSMNIALEKGDVKAFQRFFDALAKLLKFGRKALSRIKDVVKNVDAYITQQKSKSSVSGSVEKEKSSSALERAIKQQEQERLQREQEQQRSLEEARSQRLRQEQREQKRLAEEQAQRERQESRAREMEAAKPR